VSVPYAWPAPGSTDHLAVATQRLRHVEDVVLGVINAANYVEVTPPTVDVAEVFTGGTGAPRWVDSKGLSARTSPVLSRELLRPDCVT
jgi:histidyl-tRNA synthetase